MHENNDKSGHEAEHLAPPRGKETDAHGGDVQPPNRDDAGAPRAPETGEPDKH
jgi:hypothetical protein